jgi:hypothetical protein
MNAWAASGLGAFTGTNWAMMPKPMPSEGLNDLQVGIARQAMVTGWCT